MDQDRKFSNKELKALRKLEELEAENLNKRKNMIKWIAITIASVAFLGFFVAVFSFAKQSNTTNTTSQTTLSDKGWVRGRQDAKVTLVEFSDLQCPACRAHQGLVQSILEEYDGKVKLLYKHFPLTQGHKNALPASLAAEAAGKQGKFFEMHDLLFEKQPEWQGLADPSEKFASYAKGLKLDMNKFTLDSKSKELENIIFAQRDEGIAAGVSATPTFFINGRIVQAGSDISEFRRIIDEELKK